MNPLFNIWYGLRFAFTYAIRGPMRAVDLLQTYKKRCKQVGHRTDGRYPCVRCGEWMEVD